MRDEPDHRMLASLTEQDRYALKLLADQMGEHWSLERLTTLLYGIPKLVRGLPIDAPPTAELKVAQRAWFVLLYRLLIGKDTGRGCQPCCSPSGRKRYARCSTPSIAGSAAQRRNGLGCYSLGVFGTVDVPGWPAVIQGWCVPVAHRLSILEAGKV